MYVCISRVETIYPIDKADIKQTAFEFTRPEIEGGPQRHFAMPFGPNFPALKMSKRRNGHANRLQIPSSRFRAG